MGPLPESQCIYCKRSGVRFGREHVIPQAFGSFGPKTLVLNQEVCRDCNSRLGRELDKILARDSFEGLLRAELLPPRRKKKGRFKARCTIIRIPDEPKFADYRGARMAVDWRTRKPTPLDQVIARDDKGHLHSFTRDEMSGADEGLFQNRPNGSIKIIGTSSTAIRELSQIVLSKGARSASDPAILEPPPASREPTVILEIAGFIDDRVWRAIAKISFNYLAKIQGPAYVLDDKFDRIRAFIMGEFRGRALVRLSKQPILADETPQLKKHEMHLVQFERQDYGLRGRVSLFNSFTYDVMLCPDLGLIYPIKSGHAFDPVGRNVYRLVGISSSLRIRTR